MYNKLVKHKINNYQTYKGVRYSELDITYQVFGKELHSAPIVLVNHALTGNSDVISDEKGWWKLLVGKDQVIDTNKYTVIAFNIIGNGYDGLLLESYKDFIARDIAEIFIRILKKIGVQKLYAAIGGSLGGSLAWEMAALEPDLIEYLIPVASDWKSTDWIIGHNFIQESILENSKRPLYEARMMAMLFYRTSASFTKKFNRSLTEEKTQFNVESWLNHHGTKLEGRFDLLAYKMMTHLFSTVDITRDRGTFEETVKPIKSTIIQVAIDSDLLFVKEEILKTKMILDKHNISNHFYEIESIHGHDAFLIEFEQLNLILKAYFN